MNLSLCAYGREASSAPVLCRLVGRYGLSVVPALSDLFWGSLSAAVFLRFFLP